MSSIRVGRVSGVDVVAEPSVLVLAAVLAWALFIDLALDFPSADRGRIGLVAVAASVAFVGCILLHELSHALVARRWGLTVRRIRLYVFGGYTLIESDRLQPGAELVVSAAGPAASAALAAALWLVTRFVGDPLTHRALLALVVFNLAIGAFNVLPGFPLDGGRVLRAALWHRSGDQLDATRRAVRLGRILGLALIGVGGFILLRFADLTGAVWIVIGWFLFRTAQSAGRREELLARIDGLRVRDVMRDVHDAVPGSMTVARMIELYQFGPRLRSMPVEVDGRVRGILGEPEIERLSPGRRSGARAGRVMTRIAKDDVVTADTPLDVFFARPAGRTGRAIVVDDGRVVGVVESAEVAHLFEVAMRQER